MASCVTTADHSTINSRLNLSSNVNCCVIDLRIPREMEEFDVPIGVNVGNSTVFLKNKYTENLKT
jgi:hypothetical protein